VVLGLTEVEGPEELRQTDDLRPLDRSPADTGQGRRQVFGRIAGAAHLHEADFEGLTGHRESP
jgi:hypothetical protein